MQRIPLSVLDLSPIASGSTAGDALRNSLDLARHVEALGYVRYWLAEHHNAGALACSAPEVMIGQIAAVTRTLRVGAGGVMLANHSPLKVAEVFRVLHALFPGRIDLGLGRAAGTDPRTAALLRRGPASSENFPAELDALLGFLADDGPPRAGFGGGTRAAPTGVPSPPVWILGSTDQGATFAAERGYPYAFAHHFAPAGAVSAMRAYRSAFRPQKDREKPYAMLAVSALCARTEREVRELLACARLAALRLACGLRDTPMPDATEALAHAWTDEDEALVAAAAQGEAPLIGTPGELAPRLRALVEACGADELMITSHAHDHGARKESYALLAEALG